MDRYDLCVIGGGPAGVAGAIRATDLGKRVALVEAGPLGGAGIFEGALSSKTLWHLGGDFARACRSDRGYDGSGLTPGCIDGVGLSNTRRRLQHACPGATLALQDAQPGCIATLTL